MRTELTFRSRDETVKQSMADGIGMLVLTVTRGITNVLIESLADFYKFSSYNLCSWRR